MEDAFCIAERAANNTAYRETAKTINAWFLEHAKCGDGKDHFMLGMHRPADWDKPTIAPPVASAVRVAIATETQ